MPKIKNLEIVSFNEKEPPALARAFAALLKERISIDTGLKLRSIMRATNQRAQDVAAERKRLIDLYVVRGEDGEPVVTDGEVGLLPAFSEELTELLNAELEIPEFFTPGELPKEAVGEVYVSLGALLLEEGLKP